MAYALRRFAPLVLLAAVAGAACQPVKPPPPPPPPGSFITYYLSDDSSGWVRSFLPHSRTLAGGATGSQQLLADGSVVLSLANLAPATNGGSSFITVPLRLGDIQSIQLQLASTCCEGVSVQLWFDINGDSDFFKWDSNGNGGFLGPDDAASINTQASSLLIDDTTTLHVVNNMFTLGQIKAGTWKPTITPDTRVWILVRFGIFNPPPNNGSATVSALRVNGFDLLVP